MADAQTIIAKVGPLPLKDTFKAESDVEVLIFVSGSGWSKTPGQLIGMELVIDGNPVWDCVVYTNEGSSHKAFVPSFFPTKLSFGEHTIMLQPVNGETQTDLNDNFNVTLIY